MRELNITTREEGQRLDKILSKYLNKAPKSFVYKMLRKKNIKLNGKKATGNEKLSQGDQVCIYLAEDTINKFREEVKAGKQKIKLDVLYEDENVIMVNKPWGILSQKSKPEDISINDQIIPYAVNQGLISEKELQVVKPSICNRLDAMDHRRNSCSDHRMVSLRRGIKNCKSNIYISASYGGCIYSDLCDRYDHQPCISASCIFKDHQRSI